MTPARWARVQQLFDQALARPVGERTAFLDHACQGDHELRVEVGSLVDADTGPTPAVLDASSDALAAVVGAPGPTTDPDGVRVRRLDAGRVVGPYRLVREIGRGGMGTVHLAERADVGKLVALKLLQEGGATPSAVRRLLAERRVLARLEHPNIARLLDAGVTDDGAPYFAMEYVDGAPIVAASDARRLGVAERVALFLQVCDAVAYAHRNLVVHRDLKPSNVLVREDGVVKLLDFGIAKLLSADDPRDGDLRAVGGGVARAGDPTSGTWLMTPRYAAPEQRHGGAVTTATDVYALGLLLRELLTGERPPRHSAGVAALMPGLVAQEPPAGSPAALADARGTTPDRLRRALAGDLDAVIRCATQQDPAARYASAEQLAHDLRRHVAHLPVSARPLTVGYRLERLARRRRGAMLAGAAGVALVAAFSAGLVRQYRRAQSERDRAEREAETSARVTEFAVGLFSGSDPYEGASASTTARELVDRGSRRVDRLNTEPVVQARLLGVLGNVNRKLGRYDAARAQLTRAVAMQRRLPGVAPLDLAASLQSLGSLDGQQGAFAAAESSLTEALAIRRAHLGGRAAPVAATLTTLGSVAWAHGDETLAERRYREAIEVQQATGAPPADAATTLNNLAGLLSNRGRYAASDSVRRLALPLMRAAFGTRHITVAHVLMALADGASTRGDMIAADTLATAGVAMFDALVGPEHADAASARASLASIRRARGDVAGADALVTRALGGLRAAHAPPADLAIALTQAAQIRADGGDLRGAVDAARESVAIADRIYTPGAVVRLWHQVQLGATLRRAGQLREADSVLGAAATDGVAQLPAEHPYRADYLVERGTLWDAAGRHAEAEPLLRSGLAARRLLLPAQSWPVAEAQSRLGACLVSLGHRGEGATLLHAGYAGVRAARGEHDPYTRDAAARLARLTR